ncbi:MAG TPA: SMC-Scp complex subunit ScpB [Nitrospiria bacterium]|nr:SMC-Scp complex subunit ScpB [Nitrospiria bacterium]
MTQSGVAEMELAGVTDAAERAAVEAILFTTVESVTLEQLSQAIGAEASKIRRWLDQLEQELEAPHRGLQLVAVAGGYRLVTKGGVAEYLRRHRQMTAAVRLSKAALETLAIVAYKQPVLRTEVEQIRGVDCAGVLKTLLDYRLIKIVGRREMVGRPIVYGTTREFLEYFGLNALTELPTLKEFEELARHGLPGAPVGPDGGSAGTSAETAGPDDADPLPPAPGDRAAVDATAQDAGETMEPAHQNATEHPDGPQP